MLGDGRTMLTFYMPPGSYSTGIHILLETLELPFQVTVLNLPAGDHRRPDYLARNPRAKLPPPNARFLRNCCQVRALLLRLRRAQRRLSFTRTRTSL